MTDETNIEISSRPGYLFIRTSGTWTRETSLSLMNRLVVAITEAREINILVDSRDLEYDSSIFSDYLVTREMKLLQPPGSKRIAVVEKPEIKSNVELFELALRNLGINTRFFFDDKKALKWLEGDEFQSQKAV
ncbi:MAG: hypothetical protein ACOYVF_06370 [Candidatus Zixiibacteriota bacterium]